jgi:hypothetical protein
MSMLARSFPSALLLLAAACGNAPVPVEPTASDGAAPSAGTMPPGHPPVAQASRPAAAPAADAARFTAQEGWITEAPSSAMRFAQYVLPAEGEGEDASVVVFYSPGGMGSVEDNLARWAGQMEQPDGSDPLAAAETKVERRDGVVFHTIDVTGTFASTPMMPGAPAGEKKPDTRLVGTVIECDSGPYYVKLVGPSATVERWRESYDAFLAAFRP